MPAPCSEVNRRVETGTLGAEVTDAMGGRRYVGPEHLFRGARGISVWVPDVVLPGHGEEGEIPAFVDRSRWEEVPFGFGNGFGWRWPGEPQTPQQPEPLPFRDVFNMFYGVNRILSQPICGAFVTAIWNEVQAVTGRRPEENDIMSVLARVWGGGKGSGGLFYNDNSYTTPDGQVFRGYNTISGSLRDGNARILFAAGRTNFKGGGSMWDSRTAP